MRLCERQRLRPPNASLQPVQPAMRVRNKRRLRARRLEHARLQMKRCLRRSHIPPPESASRKRKGEDLALRATLQPPPDDEDGLLWTGHEHDGAPHVQGASGIQNLRPASAASRQEYPVGQGVAESHASVQRETPSFNETQSPRSQSIVSWQGSPKASPTGSRKGSAPAAANASRTN